MASLTRSTSTVATVRRQLSSVNLFRQFSSIHKQRQQLLSRMYSRNSQRKSDVKITNTASENGIAKQLSHGMSLPQLLLPVQQYRTFLARLARKSPATTHSTRTPISPVEAQAPSSPLQLTNLPYFVRRTPSNQLPVYLETKAGGTKRLTKIQKTEGDLEALRSDLAKALNLEEESGSSQSKKNSAVTINSTNGHIIVKV